MKIVGQSTIKEHIVECPHCGELEIVKTFLDKCCANPKVVFLKLKMSDNRFFYKSACISCGNMVQVKKNENLESYENSLILESDCKNKSIELKRIINEIISDRKINRKFCNKTKLVVDYNSYIQSAEWKEKRELALQRDKHICQRCKTNKANHVHHITYANIGNEYLYEIVSLCWYCHKLIHNTEKINYSEHISKNKE